MRIISGTHRSRRIDAPTNLPVRPTTDMAKESLFNILNNRVVFSELRVLDLFSGTGNITYEFASREAIEVVSVDQDQLCIKFIQQTVQKLAFEQVRVYQSDVFQFLEKHQQSFDLIFADPPYQLPNIDDIVIKVFEHSRLNAGGLLVVEHSRKTHLSHLPHFKQMRHYGSVHFSFFGTE
jgi:16S rRNA (guanine(966)-N(2))-methyltransferase RsmD